MFDTHSSTLPIPVRVDYIILYTEKRVSINIKMCLLFTDLVGSFLSAPSLNYENYSTLSIFMACEYKD